MIDELFLATEDAAPATQKKSKAPLAVESQNGTETIVKKPKSSKDAAEKKQKVSKDENPVTKKSKAIAQEENDEEIESSDDEQIDDQTEALLKGFESEEDDMDGGEGEVYKDGEPIPEPEITKSTRKKLRKAAEKAAAQTAAGQPGVVYVGRIPHGFYESEMRKYFEQFGKIKRLRLSRNRKTGASKHFAFVEFELGEVADIVSKTMDNYILFGHILKCKLVPQDQVHEKMWEGSNKRFKKVPWNKMEGRKLAQGATEAQWEKRTATEIARREAKQEKMKEIGYTFEAPKLKSAKDVPKTKRQSLILAVEADASDDEPKAIEVSKTEESAPVVEKSKKSGKKAAIETLVIEETSTPAEEPAKKQKKGKKSVAKPEVAEPVVEDVAEPEEAKPLKKGKKATKSAEKIEATAEEPAPVVEKIEPVKKGKKAKKTAEVVEAATEEPAPAVEKVEPKKKAKAKKAEAAVDTPEPVTENVEEPAKTKKAKKAKKAVVTA
jgi:nucleolar protein 15